MKNVLKVAAITPYPPSADGIADHSAKLVRAFERLDPEIEITVYSFKSEGVSREKQYPILSLGLGGWLKMYQKVKTDGADIVHLQFDVSNYMLRIFPLAATLLFIRRNTNAKLIATYHEAYRDRELYGILALIFYPLFSKLFDRIYVHSHLSKNTLIETFHTPKEKVLHIPLGTGDFTSLKINHAELRDRYDAHGKVILSFGYIYKSKGLEYLVESLDLLKQSGVTMPTVLIAGKVPKRKGVLKLFQYRNERYLIKLHEQIHSAGLDQYVRFIGFVPGDEVYSLLTLADITVLPYVSVDQSSVLNTAIAAHAPVIASDIGGMKETLAETGIVVPPRDSNAIKNELAKIVKDDNLTKHMRKSYAKLAERLDTSVVAKSLLEDYREIIQHV